MNALIDGSDPEARPSAPAEKRAAFFGLDTLIPGSSLFLLAKGLQQRRLYGRADLIGFAFQKLVSGPNSGNAPHVETSQRAALAFAQGRHRSELRALAREIADERIIPEVYPDLARLIGAHRHAGVLTFIATAGPAELAEIVAEGLGMTGGLGTIAEVGDDEHYSGQLGGPVMLGATKATAVEAYASQGGIDLAASVAYSDSINDLPLLELVGSAEVVNPDRQLRRVATQRGWPIHDLRPATKDRTRPSGAREPVPSRLAALELAAPMTVDDDTVRRGAAHHFTAEDPGALVQELESSGRFRRDTRLGSVFHRGKVSLREVSPAHSLHITVGRGNQVSAHVDRFSPLATGQPERGARYALHRVAVHNITGVAADLGRLIPGRRWRSCDPPTPPPANE